MWINKGSNPTDWIMEPKIGEVEPGEFQQIGPSFVKPIEEWPVKCQSEANQLEIELLPREEVNGARFLDVLLEQYSHVRTWSCILWWIRIFGLKAGMKMEVLPAEERLKFKKAEKLGMWCI